MDVIAQPLAATREMMRISVHAELSSAGLLHRCRSPIVVERCSGDAGFDPCNDSSAAYLILHISQGTRAMVHHSASADLLSDLYWLEADSGNGAETCKERQTSQA